MMNTDAPDVVDGYDGETRGISPALDRTLDLLSNRRRRYVLYYLRESDGGATLEELAERVASWDDQTDHQNVDHVLADLYHSQLPRLDEAGVVTFDAEDGSVRLAEGADGPIGEYLDLAARAENLD